MSIAERVAHRFIAAKAPTMAVGQALKLIDERAGFKRPIEARLYQDVLQKHMPPNDFRRAVWEQLLDAKYLQIGAKNDLGKPTVILSDEGKIALNNWQAKAKGKLVYERDSPELWIVELDGQQIGQWTRSGDPSVRGYRRVGYEEPAWFFLVDAYDEVLEETLRKLPKDHKGFEGLTLPPEAKKWLADQLKLIGVLR